MPYIKIIITGLKHQQIQIATIQPLFSVEQKILKDIGSGKKVAACTTVWMIDMKKKRIKNGYMFWNAAAGIMLISLVMFRQWILGLRVEHGFLTAPAWIMNADYISGGMINAIMFGWIVGNILAKTKKT